MFDASENEGLHSGGHSGGKLGHLEIKNTFSPPTCLGSIIFRSPASSNTITIQASDVGYRVLVCVQHCSQMYYLR